MLIKEYRVILPITVAEYQVGQLWSVAEASKAETGGGEGVEVLKNEPYTDVPLLAGQRTDGQFTHKIYHLQSKVPSFIRMLAPRGSLSIHEEAWNAYPYCKTVLTNPDYMKENFIIKVETIHLPDRGTTENAHQLSAKQLEQREVVYLDIANDAVNPSDYKEETDPAKFRSKNGRGPLGKDWMKTCEPVMCAYKLVTVEFKWWGLQGRIEKFIQSQYPRLFGKFHREVVCWQDKWIHLSMEDIRRIEEEAKKALDEERQKGGVRGMVADKEN